MTDRRENNLKWIWEALRPFRGIIFLLIVLNVLGTVVTLSVTVFLRNLIDAAVAKNYGMLRNMTILMIVMTVLQVGISLLNRYIQENTSYRITQHLQKRLFYHLLNKDYTYITEKHSGEWMNRLILDVDGIGSAATSMVPGLAAVTVHFIGAGWLLFRTAPVFLLLVAIGGCALAMLNKLLKEPLKKRQHELRNSIGKKNVYLTEHLNKLVIVKAFNREKIIVENADEMADEVRKKKVHKLHLLLFKDGVQKSSTKLAFLLVLIYCAVRIFQGKISYGTSVMFMRLMSEISTPLTNVSTYFNNFFDVIVSAERMREVEAYPDDPDRPVLEDTEIRDFYEREFKDIAFCGAAFSYLDQDEDSLGSVPTVFSNVDLIIPKQSCVAFTGITGSGKSTFFKLLMSLYSLKSGTKIIHTVKGEEIPLDVSFRRLFAYVPQGNQLMAGTIREMVTFGIRENLYKDEEIWKVLEEACAKDFIEALPHQLDTEIKEKGVGLSEGQLQRIAIARALFTKRPILLLDEATSALDENTENRLLQHLKEMTDRTILFVTHRPNALSICDREVHIDGTSVTMRMLGEQEG